MAISKIDTIITPFTVTPQINTPTFPEDIDQYNTEQPGRITETNDVGQEMNDMATDMDIVATQVDADAIKAETSALVASSAANYQGDWIPSFETVGYAKADSVTYTDGQNYVSKVDDNLVEPTEKTDTAEWNFIDSVTQTELDLKADQTAVDLKADQSEVDAIISFDYKRAVDPTINTNPTKKATYINDTSGEIFVCSDFTTDKNIWIGQRGTTISPVIPIQEAGSYGFGTTPTSEPFAVMGLAKLNGTDDPTHDNYGNYIQYSNGSIMCWKPKAFLRIGHEDSPNYADYGANAVDIKGTDVYANEAEANAGGYFLPRCFIDGGEEKAGFFIDKYMASKDNAKTMGVSIRGGIPISLTTDGNYTNSADMLECTGIYADSVPLAKARGVNFSVASVFMYGYLAMASLAHGQASISIDNCAWYDATDTTNYPKGCNNDALSDTDDSSVVYDSADDAGTSAKPRTGATQNFNKTTDNGCANGVADLNGGMWEVSIGVTNYGTTATASDAIATDDVYLLKHSVALKDLKGGWDSTNDVWGNATHLDTLYDLVTSPHALGSTTGTVKWGNGTNAVISNDQSGVSRDLAGFIPKDNNATNADGTNLFGTDYIYRYNRQNLFPLCSGNWNGASLSGLFARGFGNDRTNSNYGVCFRASAFLG